VQVSYYITITLTPPGYKRVGAMGATCVDGAWSPAISTQCVPGKYPKLMYIFRGKRDTELQLPGTELQLHPGTEVDEDENLVDREGKYDTFDKGTGL
jgi:hypothetical protein